VYPHRIRLRGPWECEPLSRTPAPPGDRVEPLQPKGRVTLPCRWGECGLSGFAGRVRFRRRFGYPGRLDSFERVWLTFDGVEGTADVSLNGQVLGRREGAQGPFEFEVTNLLQARNELVVEVEAPDDRAGLWGEVAQEVRCTAFLRGVRLAATFAGETARLHVTGEVVGTSEQSLELYVLLGRSTVAYAVVPPAPEGRPFHVISDELGPERWQTGGEGGGTVHEVRVELVNTATVWFTVEQTFEFRPAS
jgi:hypothetical protein